MAERPTVSPQGVSRRGMAQDSLTSGNLTRALGPQTTKSDAPPPATGSAGGGKAPDGGK